MSADPRSTELRAVPRGETPWDPGRRLRFLGVPLMGLLAIEFLLGMALNLFVPPTTGTPAAILAADPILIVHLLVAILLLGITAQATRLGLQVRQRRPTIGGLVGFTSALVATLAGLAFTFGGQSAVASYVMSLGFAGVFLGAVVLLMPSDPRGPDAVPMLREPAGSAARGVEP